jgi:hypothetical protein
VFLSVDPEEDAFCVVLQRHHVTRRVANGFTPLLHCPAECHRALCVGTVSGKDVSLGSSNGLIVQIVGQELAAPEGLLSTSVTLGVTCARLSG